MLLQYVNTESLPQCEDEGGYNVGVMQHLMDAAHTYKMDRMRLMCEKQLRDQINMELWTWSVVTTHKSQLC
jgi:hypothetical protein